jgi:hypothetical protein
MPFASISHAGPRSMPSSRPHSSIQHQHCRMVSQINRPLAQFWTSLIDVCSTEIIENDAGQVLDGAIRLRCNLIPISLDLEFVQQLEGQHSFRCQADTLSGNRN